MKNPFSSSKPTHPNKGNELDFDSEAMNTDDQTSFADSAPFTGVVHVPTQKKVADLETNKKTWSKNQKILAIVGGIFGVLLLTLLIIMLFRQAPPEPEVIEPLPTAQPVNDGFTQKIRDTEILLKESDPAFADDQLPPVNLELRLDPAER